MLPEIKKILYATDLGPGSTYVFRYALSLAQRYQAKVTILHAVEPLSPFAQSMVELYVSHQDSEQKHATVRTQLLNDLKSRLHEFCEQEVSPAEEELVADIRVVEGDAAQTISQEAVSLGSDIIVMGTHRHSVVGETLLGTTAHRVLHSCPLPTLLVRIPEPPENGAGL